MEITRDPFPVFFHDEDYGLQICVLYSSDHVYIWQISPQANAVTTPLEDDYSTLMVILPMPCWGCRVKPHGMNVPSDAFTHIIPFLFIFSIWWKI